MDTDGDTSGQGDRFVTPDYPTPAVAYQVCHFAWGLAIVWGTVAVLVAPAWTGLVMTLGLVIIKEWAIDIVMEKDTWQGSLLDSCFYLIGALVGMAAVGVRLWIA